jgi:prephenate dehydrogenase
MDKKLSKAVYTIATHPMFGPDSGKHGIKGLPWWSARSPSRGHRQQMACLVKKWGWMSSRMTCDEHDKEAALEPRVTHFVGRTLDQLHLKDTRLLPPDTNC